MIALFQILITYPNDQEFPNVMIQSCYDGDTCTTIQGEKIRLACFDTPEFREKGADSNKAKASKRLS